MNRSFHCLLIGTVVMAGCFNARGTAFTPVVPQAHSATIYVYRPGTFVGSGNWDVPTLFLDDKPIGKVRIDGYLPIEVAPGNHSLHVMNSASGIGAQKNEIGRISISVKEHDVIYIRYELGIDSFLVPAPGVAVMTGKHAFQIVPSETAEREISATALSQ